MKAMVWAMVALTLGGGLGATQAWREFTRDELFQPFNPNLTKAGSKAVKNIIVVNGETFEFGTLPRGKKMTHQFILQNVSDHPIEIWVGQSSCTCTVASLGEEDKNNAVTEEDDLGSDTEARKRLQPSETTEVAMEWEGAATNPHFFQTADIHTSDPGQPSIRLSVNGSVQALLSITPESIRMNNVSVEKGAIATTTVYCAREKFPAVEETQFMTADTADKFEVEWTELGADHVDPDRRSARRLIVRAKPGLPIGTVSQQLRLKLGIKGENTLYVPITAKVTSELSILGGRDYLSDAGVIRWGVVDRQEGRETTLYIIVNGDHRERVKLEVESIDPKEAIQLDILPVKNREAKSWTIPVKVSLRPDCPTVTRLGGAESYGEVTLRTGHPVAKELKFRIQFAVN